jgi:hypothetical protein
MVDGTGIGPADATETATSGDNVADYDAETADDGDA